eukprot:TRINITY_DN2948_c0_g1_i10.p1 TRINITY_DN2948_c0_g1~~TRINITY_DN2948_c0_g1_i10.p1  ORF type:complete len:516 (+),score=138.07 TRINITY_DN2948_c0_g1_i10:49-1548(+)
MCIRDRYMGIMQMLGYSTKSELRTEEEHVTSGVRWHYLQEQHVAHEINGEEWREDRVLRQSTLDLFQNDSIEVQVVVKVKRPLPPERLRAIEYNLKHRLDLRDLEKTDGWLFYDRPNQPESKSPASGQRSTKSPAWAGQQAAQPLQKPRTTAHTPKRTNGRQTEPPTISPEKTTGTPRKTHTPKRQQDNSRGFDGKVERLKTPVRATKAIERLAQPKQNPTPRGAERRVPYEPLGFRTTWRSAAKKSSPKQKNSDAASQGVRKYIVMSPSEDAFRKVQEARAEFLGEALPSIPEPKKEPQYTLPADVSFEVAPDALMEKEQPRTEANHNPHQNVPIIRFRISETYPDGSKYEGEALEGLPHGEGKMIFASGGSYEGHWELGQMEGLGKMYYPSGDLAYDGEMKHDKFNGRGILLNDMTHLAELQHKGEPLWLRYEGEFFDDAKHGFGICYYADGSVYEGHFKNDLHEGEGKLKDAEGNIIIGLWENNQMVHCSPHRPYN